MSYISNYCSIYNFTGDVSNVATSCQSDSLTSLLYYCISLQCSSAAYYGSLLLCLSSVTGGCLRSSDKGGLGIEAKEAYHIWNLNRKAR